MLFLLFSAPEVFDFSSRSSRAFSRHVFKLLMLFLLLLFLFFPWPLLFRIHAYTACFFVHFFISLSLFETGIQDVFCFHHVKLLGALAYKLKSTLK